MSKIRNIAHDLTPPLLWRALRNITGRKQGESAINYQGVITQHSMQKLHQSRFSDVYERFRALNPQNSENLTRLRIYFACMFADFSRAVDGDFLSAGISYGVAPRIVYDYVRFEELTKIFHFVDPFTGVNNPSDSESLRYNDDVDYVKKQYPQDAPIRIHQALVPECFPLCSVKALAFVHLNTTHPPSEANSLPYLYETLSPGGFILIDYYCFGEGQFKWFDPVAERLGVSIYSLVTGQGVLHKPCKA